MSSIIGEIMSLARGGNPPLHRINVESLFHLDPIKKEGEKYFLLDLLHGSQSCISDV